MATHSSILAWRIPGMGEPGGLPSMGSQSWTQLKRLSSIHYLKKKSEIFPVALYLQISQIPNMKILSSPITHLITSSWVFALPSLKSFHQSIEGKEERRTVGLTILSFLPPGAWTRLMGFFSGETSEWGTSLFPGHPLLTYQHHRAPPHPPEKNEMRCKGLRQVELNS